MLKHKTHKEKIGAIIESYARKYKRTTKYKDTLLQRNIVRNIFIQTGTQMHVHTNIHLKRHRNKHKLAAKQELTQTIINIGKQDNTYI